MRTVTGRVFQSPNRNQPKSYGDWYRNGTVRPRGTRALNWLLHHGSYGILFGALVANGFGLPIPEDLVLLVGGALAHRGITQFPVTLAVCFTGVLTGDAILFTAAQHLGPRAFDHRRFRRFLTPKRRARLEALFERHGGLVVFIGRHLPGLRPAVFALAATHKMARWRFLLWDLLGACITAPLVLWLGFQFSDRLERVRVNIRYFKIGALGLAVVGLIAYVVFRWIRRRGNAQRD
jgi:membrane protein DedA with SNARE-associated domain